jgi:hypothetical protein
MRITRLRIDGQEFYLPPELDLAALQQQLLDAVRGEAAFVTFPSVGHGEVSVLVTAHVPVRFEVEELAEEEVQRLAEDPPAIDIHEHFQSF